MAAFNKFYEPALRAICDILGETSSGLTGSEIGKILADCGINDPLPGITKRERLFQALSQRQNLDRSGNNVVSFIYSAMNPIRYTKSQELFDTRQSDLNKVLSFQGLMLTEEGKLIKITASRTLSEALERAGKLRRELTSRKVHPDVLRFCKAELLQDNFFHAVFEATKSVADKIREKSGLHEDGSRLIDLAFGGKPPLLAFNTLQTETEQSELKGLMNLLKGLFGILFDIVDSQHIFANICTHSLHLGVVEGKIGDDFRFDEV